MAEPSTSSRPTPSPVKVFFLSLALSALGLGLLLVGDRGTGQWRHSKAELASLENQVAQLRAENQELERRLVDAGRNDFEIEKSARENLGLVRSDDVVFVLPEKSPRPSTASGKSSAPKRN